MSETSTANLRQIRRFADRPRLAAVADALAALSLVAWVGGHTALGAFTARILFRDLPREVAAPTMTTIFRSFDGVIWVALVVLLLAAGVRALAVGVHTRTSQVVLGASLALAALGLFELLYVHPGIEALFRAGNTLDPAFAVLHRLSERCGHLELLLTAAILGGQAWSRARA